jgi:hypothetical protein
MLVLHLLAYINLTHSFLTVTYSTKELFNNNVAWLFEDDSGICCGLVTLVYKLKTTQDYVTGSLIKGQGSLGI